SAGFYLAHADHRIAYSHVGTGAPGIDDHVTQHSGRRSQSRGDELDARFVAIGEGALQVELVERLDGGMARLDERPGAVLDRAAAGAIGRCGCLYPRALDVGAHERTFE